MTMPADVPPANDPQGEGPHKPADDSEEVYFQGSPMLRGDLTRLTIFWLVGLVVMFVPILFKPHFWWVYLIGVAVGIIILMVPILMTRSVRYRISNYRIDYERGILSRDIDTLELWHVEDIAFHQTLMDRILGVGNITVISHDDTTPKLLLHSLPKSRDLFDALKQRIIAVKRQRGVIKMDVPEGHPAQ